MSPADLFDEAIADMISDGVTDVFKQFSQILYEKDETKKVMRKLMSVSVSHIQSLSGFTPEIANQSVFFFSLFLQSASRDIREFERRRLSSLSDARQSEVNFLQCWVVILNTFF